MYLRLGLERFWEVENIGYALNSYADDYYFYKSDSTDAEKSFISSNRSGGMSKENPTFVMIFMGCLAN